MQNCTVRDNITFGSHYSPAAYNTTVDACALRPDLEMLPGGDQTEIGEKARKIINITLKIQKYARCHRDIPTPYTDWYPLIVAVSLP